MATQKGRNWSSGDIVTAANLSSVERGVSAMAEEYTPTTWSNGDTVTAAGLNNIEQGITNASGGGGGNPNTVQTVTGTLSNMFGNVDLDELEDALSTLNATAYVEIDASALGAGMIHGYMQVNTETHLFYVGGSALLPTLSASTAYYVEWGAGALNRARMLSNGNIVDISSYGSTINTTMTIVWHPLPN
jgi:hypothetical protein